MASKDILKYMAWNYATRPILVINKPLFHAVVNENLPLFQLILGPSVTSQKLLDALVIEDQPFHFLLKYNNVLVGKLLGYGTQNSLYVSRLEGIQEAIGESIPPFLQGNSFTRVHREEYLPYPPSFGYKNIQDEFVELDEKIIISSKKLIEENPPYGFGRLKNQESEQVIHKLEETQSLIQKLLKSPFFVEQALEMITQKKFKSMSTSGFKFQFDNTKKVQLLVREIWNSIQSYDLSYCSHFINGLNGASFPMTKMDRKTWDPGYSQEMQKAKENLIHAKAHFCEIESKERFVSIVPKKLYFKINTPGKEKNEIGSLVKLTYSIFSPSGDCLASQSEVLINLKNTISGFRLGIKGMKIGETRELWIHPALAYGYNTSLEKCIYLKAIVTLIDTIDSEKTEIHSNNEEIDLEFLLDSNIDKTIAESSAAVALRSGTQLRQLLSKDSTLDISKITIDLKEKIDKNKSFQEPPEKDLLNQVLWNLLFTSK